MGTGSCGPYSRRPGRLAPGRSKLREAVILGMGLEDVVLILVGHGSPPRSYPHERVAEYIGLEKRVRAGDPTALERFRELDEELRSYPRTPENDPYWYNLTRLAEAVKKASRFLDVIPAFNEFCRPSLEEAVEEAAKRRPEAIVVVPTMIVRGGEHSEEEIPEKLKEIMERHPGLKIIYAWPYDVEDQVELFVKQARRFLDY